MSNEKQQLAHYLQKWETACAKYPFLWDMLDSETKKIFTESKLLLSNKMAVATKSPLPDINKTELQIAIGNWWRNQSDSLYKYTKEGSKINLRKLSDVWAVRKAELNSIAAVKKVLSEWVYDAKKVEKNMSIEGLKSELDDEYNNFLNNANFKELWASDKNKHKELTVSFFEASIQNILPLAATIIPACVSADANDAPSPERRNQLEEAFISWQKEAKAALDSPWLKDYANTNLEAENLAKAFVQFFNFKGEAFSVGSSVDKIRSLKGGKGKNLSKEWGNIVDYVSFYPNEIGTKFSVQAFRDSLPSKEEIKRTLVSCMENITDVAEYPADVAIKKLPNFTGLVTIGRVKMYWQIGLEMKLFTNDTEKVKFYQVVVKEDSLRFGLAKGAGSVADARYLVTQTKAPNLTPVPNTSGAKTYNSTYAADIKLTCSLVGLGQTTTSGQSKTESVTTNNTIGAEVLWVNGSISNDRTDENSNENSTQITDNPSSYPLEINAKISANYYLGRNKEGQLEPKNWKVELTVVGTPTIKVNILE